MVNVKFAMLSWVLLLLHVEQAEALLTGCRRTLIPTSNRPTIIFPRRCRGDASALWGRHTTNNDNNDNNGSKDTLASKSSSSSSSSLSSSWLNVPEAIEKRYACKAFQRFDGKLQPEKDAAVAAVLDEASPPDPWIVQQASRCLNLARLSPSSFNTQPYKVVLVHSVAQKTALARACLGPNARRVLDSDCTAVFLADKQVLREVLPHRKRQQQNNSTQQSQRQGPPTAKTPLLYITLFSSGYPLPRWLSSTISFFVRTAVSWIDIVTRKLFRYPMPTLSNAETWATKQTSLVAMTYMLACAAKGIATIPMEGLNAAAIRRVVGARGARYAVPLIVATGRSTLKDKKGGEVQTRRYPTQQVLFGNSLNEPLLLD